MASHSPNSFDEVFDPTDTHALHKKKDGIILALKDNHKYKALLSSSPGLVLSGGGGKGAYEAGVILALYDCGIVRYSSIAGTSVGALNAALCQQLVRKNDRNIVLRMWANLTFSQVLQITRTTIWKIALYIPMSLATNFDISRNSPLIRGDAETENWKDVILRLFPAWLHSTVPIMTATLLLGALVITMGYLQHEFHLFHSEMAFYLTFFLLLYIIPRFAKWLSQPLGIFSNAPLRKTIEKLDIEDVRTGFPKVICTLASHSTYQSGNAQASYLTLAQTESHEKATDILLQSAALPEIFPLRSIGDEKYVDGGVADNTPILGLAHHPTNHLIVVYLDHRFTRMLKRYQKWGFGNITDGQNRFWDRITALKEREVSRLSKITGESGKDWSQFSAWFWDLNIFPIIPSQDIAQYGLGTLDFRTSTARMLIELGYSDALCQLKQWCQEQPHPLRPPTP